MTSWRDPSAIIDNYIMPSAGCMMMWAVITVTTGLSSSPSESFIPLNFRISINWIIEFIIVTITIKLCQINKIRQPLRPTAAGRWIYCRFKRLNGVAAVSIYDGSHLTACSSRRGCKQNSFVYGNTDIELELKGKLGYRLSTVDAGAISYSITPLWYLYILDLRLSLTALQASCWTVLYSS